MRRVWLTLARLCATGWIGAALFFVSVAIQPIRAPEFDSLQRAQLSRILFTGYYAMGVGAMTVALVTGWLAYRRELVNRKRGWTFLALLAASLAVTLFDWFWVYGPLAAMMNDAVLNQVALPGSFRNYHIASMLINALGIGFGLAAAIVICLPERWDDLSPSRR